MKGGGKYIRVWVYDANAAYLNSVDNQGRVVNEALAAYSQLQSGNVVTSPSSAINLGDGTTMRSASLSVQDTVTDTGGYSIANTVTPAYANMKLTCDHGHLMNAVTGKCVGKMCEFAK